MLFKHIYLIVFTAVLLQPVTAQVKLFAVPSKTIIHPDETIQLQFVAEGVSKADDFIPPAFKNFELVSGPFESNGWTWVNGSLIEYISYTYLLKPKTKGKLLIGEAVMKAKGKIISTQVVIIQVTDAVSLNKGITASPSEEKPDYYLLPKEDVQEKIRKNLFVKAIVDKKSCYVGEAILATFKLYTRLDSESKIVKRPSFNGFSVIDLEEPETGLFTKEVVDGKVYNCYLIRKVQLFPLQSGELKIEPVEIINKVRLIRSPSQDGKDWLETLTNKEKQEALNQESIVEEQMIMETDPLQITVKELPADKPESFNGAVGSFAIKANLVKNEFKTDENGILKVQISGRGNIHMINAPLLTWPKGFEVFEPKVKEELFKLVSPISGIKEFEIPFTTSEGVFQLAPVVFSFFDVASKTYKTIQSNQLTFKVQSAEIKKGQLLEEPENGNNASFSKINKWFLAVIPMVLILIAVYLRLSKKKSIPKTIISEEPIPLKPHEIFLNEALYSRDSFHYKQFYSLLLNGLQEFFADRFQMQHQIISRTAWRQLLLDKHLVKESELWTSILNRCEDALFSPVELSISKDELLKDAERVMALIDQS
jgi:hypothetical protein